MSAYPRARKSGACGGPVGRGCHDMHIRDLRTCTHAHLGFADLHIRDLRTCTHAHLGFADLHIRNLRTCTYAYLGFADLHIRDLRKCNCFHVVTTCSPRGCHVATTWKQLHFRKSRKSRMCKSANPRCACVQVRKSRMCKSANPRCACVHVRKSRMCTS